MFICIAPAIMAQQNESTVAATALDNWHKHNLQEKLFVHTDKDVYLPGEIAWFKIYYVDGTFHRPLQLSEIAYLELIDKSNKPVMQTMVSLKKLAGSGSFLVPSELTTGYYKLRCYTQWMRNFDANFFFEKKIAVVTAEQSARDTAQPKKEIYDLGFFPEGGNLIDGVESKIAFHVTNQYGIGLDGNGIILDGNDTLIRFETAKMGMGHFSLTPVAGHHYLGRFTLSNGQIIEKQLPASLDHGTTMKLIDNGDGKLLVSIMSKYSAASSVILFAHTRGVVKTTVAIPIVNGLGATAIDKNLLDEGITHFTVFDNERPVCERLYFTFPRNRFQILASSEQAEYGKRNKIKINIKTSDEKGSPEMAQVSAAIYRLDNFADSSEINIQNYLLLASDLNGYIESPSWYFADQASKGTAMDDLMLTHGWRRFKWNDILSSQKTAWKYAPEYNGEIFSARVTDKRSGSLVDNARVFLSIPGATTKFWSSITDMEGVANFEIKNSFGNREFIMQSSDSNAAINFISPFSTEHSAYQLPPFNKNSFDSTVLNRKSIYVQVQHAYHENNLDSFVAYKDDKAPFFLKPDVVYSLDRFTRFTTMEEVLREYIREVNVVNYGGSFHLHVMNGITRMPFQTDPLILLDGVAMLDINKFMEYDPFKIKTIEVVTRKYFLGNMSYFGIVDCKTYKGDMDGYAVDPRSVILDFDGLQQQREFYSPSYETVQQQSTRMPDFRTTLYWNPSLRTAGGNSSLEFYSSDAAGRYVVVVQGISDRGIPAVTSFYFNVKK